jgi:hypothetical protein
MEQSKIFKKFGGHYHLVKISRAPKKETTEKVKQGPGKKSQGNKRNS